ncbi:MAG: glycoside hydrolase family 172 protein [Armatimonadota bacterium]
MLATASLSQTSPVPKGTWQELIDVTQLPYLKDSKTMEMSSYDRTGGNDDGFSGAYSFIRKEGDDWVIFEEKGPGCIQRIWTATHNTGRVAFYFDGETEPRIDLPSMTDLFNGRHEPFVQPISNIMMGAGWSYVPIPFAKSCKIVVTGPVSFYQVSWQKFPDDREIKTFSMDMTPDERKMFNRVKDAWSNIGRNPWQTAKNAQTIKQSTTVRPGARISLADLDGPGMIRSIRVKMQSRDARAFRRALLEVYTDNIKKPTVWSPLGDFFADGFGAKTTNTMMVGVKNDTYYCYFPMPFEQGMIIRITNDAKSPIKLETEVVWEPMESIPADMGRFFAWWHRQNPTIDRELFPILDVEGRGHWCGVSHSMQGKGGFGFLEGDEMAWIDGRDNSTYNGTGTEDYFNSGWYFGTTGNAPLHGCGVLDGSNSRCLATRLHITDYVPFQSKARIGIEHGPISDIEADYAGVTYWYAEPTATHKFNAVDADDRLPQPTHMPNAIEAEEALNVSRSIGASVMDDNDMEFTLSGGKAVAAHSTNGIPVITMNIDIKASGIYTLDTQFLSSPKGGLVQAYVDGRQVGKPIDTSATGIKIIPLAETGELSWLRKGKHDISFKPADITVSRQEIMVDCIRLRDAGRVIEAEDLKVIRGSGEPIGRQDLAGFGTGWSGEAHMWFRPKTSGTSFTLELPIEEDGRYSLSIYYTKASDYGTFQVKLDGVPMGEPFDGFKPGVIRSERTELGTVDLTKGAHELTFEVTGKNRHSTDYMVGVDSILVDRIR